MDAAHPYCGRDVLSEISGIPPDRTRSDPRALCAALSALVDEAVRLVEDLGATDPDRRARAEDRRAEFLQAAARVTPPGAQWHEQVAALLDDWLRRLRGEDPSGP